MVLVPKVIAIRDVAVTAPGRSRLWLPNLRLRSAPLAPPESK